MLEELFNFDKNVVMTRADGPEPGQTVWTPNDKPLSEASLKLLALLNEVDYTVQAIDHFEGDERIKTVTYKNNKPVGVIHYNNG